MHAPSPRFTRGDAGVLLPQSRVSCRWAVATLSDRSHILVGYGDTGLQTRDEHPEAGRVVPRLGSEPEWEAGRPLGHLYPDAHTVF